MDEKYDEDHFVEDTEMNVYKKKSRDELVENDEISPEEEAFMQGYYDEDDDEEEKE
ncbi:MAG: hypothetical protein ACOC3X_02040 [Nanoarchaeota archaeon]